MVITIAQARKAVKSSQTAVAAMTAVQSTAIAERLRAAQEHIREAAPSRITQRGAKPAKRIASIRLEFDNALSALPRDGKGGAAREQLARAQTQLNSYEASLTGTPNLISWETLQTLVQDTISDLTADAIRGFNKNDK